MNRGPTVARSEDAVLQLAAPRFSRRQTFYERFLKRPIDVTGAIVLLILLGPLFVIVGCGVAITMGRPVVFRQRRLGRNGVPFTMFKFRSMKPIEHWDESVLGPRPVHAPEDDPRHTPFGRFIRRLSLDELPQLWNVLRGDMSLIGPRPELPDIAEEFDLVHHPRHLVRPGMTGEWQVSELRAGFVHMNVHLDALYVGHLSFRRDLAIALRTLGLFLGVRPRPAIDPEWVEARVGATLHSRDATVRGATRVLHVLEPPISGVPAYVQQLGRELAERGIEQIVITGDHQEWDFSEWAHTVVQVPWRRGLRNTVTVGREVRRAVMDADIDLIHAHATFAGIATRLVRQEVPVVYQPHGWGHFSTRQSLACALARWVERRLDPRTDVLVVLSDEEAADAPRNRPASRVGPIVELEGFAPVSESHRSRRRLELGWPADERVLLCVGELTHRKNQIGLVRAWRNLDPTGFRLVLVGSGPRRDEIDVLAAETRGVEVLGWRTDIGGLMAAADALVVASLGEGFSLVILEALASGLPVFTTPVGGSEIVSGDDGLVRADAEGVLRAALGSELTGPSLSERRCRAERILASASVDTVADEFVTIYRAAVGTPEVIEADVADGALTALRV